MTKRAIFMPIPSKLLRILIITRSLATPRYSCICFFGMLAGYTKHFGYVYRWMGDVSYFLNTHGSCAVKGESRENLGSFRKSSSVFSMTSIVGLNTSTQKDLSAHIWIVHWDHGIIRTSTLQTIH